MCRSPREACRAGNQSPHEADQRADAKRKDKYCAVQTDRVHPRQFRWTKSDQSAYPKLGHHHS